MLLAVLSVYFFFKTINEIKQNKYIGAGVTAGNTIVISGEGSIDATPNIATETVTIQEDGTTQKDAQDKVSVKEKKVLDFLKTAGVADADIKTTSNSVYPKYDYGTVQPMMGMVAPSIPCGAGYPCPPTKQVISGYTASESIDVKIRNTDDTGKIVQGLTAIGVQLYGPNFTIDNEDALKAQAREKAIADAKAKANALAHDLGVSFGRIVNFSENTGGYPIMYAAKAEGVSSSGASPAPTLPTGQNKITVDVTITYEIK